MSLCASKSFGNHYLALPGTHLPPLGEVWQGFKPCTLWFTVQRLVHWTTTPLQDLLYSIYSSIHETSLIFSIFFLLFPLAESKTSSSLWLDAEGRHVIWMAFTDWLSCTSFQLYLSTAYPPYPLLLYSDDIHCLDIFWTSSGLQLQRITLHRPVFVLLYNENGRRLDDMVGQRHSQYSRGHPFLEMMESQINLQPSSLNLKGISSGIKNLPLLKMELTIFCAKTWTLNRWARAMKDVICGCNRSSLIRRPLANRVIHVKDMLVMVFLLRYLSDLDV